MPPVGQLQLVVPAGSNEHGQLETTTVGGPPPASQRAGRFALPKRRITCSARCQRRHAGRAGGQPGRHACSVRRQDGMQTSGLPSRVPHKLGQPDPVWISRHLILQVAAPGAPSHSTSRIARDQIRRACVAGVLSCLVRSWRLGHQIACCRARTPKQHAKQTAPAPAPGGCARPPAPCCAR